MKAEIDFSKAVRGKFRDSVPANAIFVQFSPQVAHLFTGEGSFADRLRRASKAKGRSSKMVLVIAFSKTEFAELRALIERLEGKVLNPAAAKAKSRKAS